MGILIQYGNKIAEFHGDTIYDTYLTSNALGSFTSNNRITSNYANCLGYSFDNDGKIYYNYGLIAYCENGRVIKWIGSSTIAYFDGDIRGAAAAAIIILLAPKYENASDNTTSKIRQDDRRPIAHGNDQYDLGKKVRRDSFKFFVIFGLYLLLSAVLLVFVIIGAIVDEETSYGYLYISCTLLSVLITYFFKEYKFEHMIICNLIVLCILLEICTLLFNIMTLGNFFLVILFSIMLGGFPATLTWLAKKTIRNSYKKERMHL